MKRLIGRLKFEDFTTPEPNPWRKLEKASAEWDNPEMDPKILELEMELRDWDSSDETDYDDDDDDDEEDEEEDNGEPVFRANGQAIHHNQLAWPNAQFLSRPTRWTDYCIIL